MYLVSAGRNLYVRTLCSRYVCTWYQPAEIYTYVRYVPPVDAHVWRQLHLSAVARCSDSYCIFYLFERSEFLIATPKKKYVCVCACSTKLGLSGEKKLCVCSTNLGFSVGYVLCTRYVCTTLYDTRYVLCTKHVWYQVPGTYYVPDTYVPHLPLYY